MERTAGGSKRLEGVFDISWLRAYDTMRDENIEEEEEEEQIVKFTNIYAVFKLIKFTNIPNLPHTQN